MRNHLGQFFHAITANLGVCPIAIAEVWGAFYSLQLAWQLGHKKVILEIDSSVAVTLINKDIDFKHPYGSVIARIKEKLAGEH